MHERTRARTRTQAHTHTHTHTLEAAGGRILSPIGLGLGASLTTGTQNTGPACYIFNGLLLGTCCTKEEWTLLDYTLRATLTYITGQGHRTIGGGLFNWPSFKRFHLMLFNASVVYPFTYAPVA